MEQLIRDMDVRIRKNKERADAESRPKVLKLDDQKRLDAMKQQQAGEPLQAIGLHNTSPKRTWRCSDMCRVVLAYVVGRRLQLAACVC